MGVFMASLNQIMCVGEYSHYMTAAKLTRNASAPITFTHFTGVLGIDRALGLTHPMNTFAALALRSHVDFTHKSVVPWQILQNRA
jgi:hypothetical protein